MDFYVRGPKFSGAEFESPRRYGLERGWGTSFAYKNVAVLTIVTSYHNNYETYYYKCTYRSSGYLHRNQNSISTAIMFIPGLPVQRINKSLTPLSNYDFVRWSHAARGAPHHVSAVVKKSLEIL
ncbi:hypothetical protein QTP88_017110 [Uroleucon formosanum]